MLSALSNRNVALLLMAQALFMVSQNMMIIEAALVGQMIALDKSLATLPITAMVVGTLFTAIPASLLMKRIGRRSGFMLAAFIGCCAAAISAYAIGQGGFWLFVFGAFFIGVYSGFAQYYRFAAAEVVGPDKKSQAISLVLAGGIVAAFFGAPLANWSKDLFAPVTFQGTYAIMAIIAISAILVLAMLRVPQQSSEEVSGTAAPIKEILMRPAFIAAVVSATVGYCVMSLIMTATPLAMAGCGLPFEDTSFVIQWHVLGMFVPSFFTGSLIKRFGVLPIMFAGIALNVFCVLVAISGIEVSNFWLALLLLGVGWNFLFVGGTTLLTDAYSPAEKAKTQAANDFILFGSVAIATYSSGWVQHYLGWDMVNYLALPFLGITTLILAWYGMHTRRTQAQAA